MTFKDTHNATVLPDEQDYFLDSYNFELPEKLIAQKPAATRDLSRLLVYNRATDRLVHTVFRNIGDFLPPAAMLVANNVKVMPARLSGTKASGGKVEIVLLSPIAELGIETVGDKRESEVNVLLRPASRIRAGQEVQIAAEFSLLIQNVSDFGQARARLRWKGELADLLHKHGHMPLPPYIKRPDNAKDAERYQTVYATDRHLGAVAAPTAGLHFNQALHAELQKKGLSWQELTLFVGYGTFSPVRKADIREHQMHSELIRILPETARNIREAKQAAHPIVAVGTTSARALEGMHAALGEIAEFRGETDVFIYPGRRLEVVDHLITNFHLPKSSLLMLVSALTGRAKLLEIYQEAIAREYRFFSYGDAMLIL